MNANRRAASVATAILFLGSLTGATLVWDSHSVLAQSENKSKLRMGSIRSAKKSTRSAASSRKAKAPKKAESESAKNAEDAEDAEDAGNNGGEGSKASGGFVASLRDFVRGNATWIVVALLCTIAGVGLWAWIGRGKSSGVEAAFADLDEEESSPAKKRRYTSTRIEARAVNDGLAVETSEVETNQEYALVVDEDALKKPPVDDHTGRAYEDASEIEGLLAERRFDEAYGAYVTRIEGEGEREFQAEVEETLSEHFIGERRFNEAARVLEHHVATHAAEDIAPEMYFNLGYVHFFNNRLTKSRRFLNLYVERQGEGERVERARKILDALAAR